MTTREKDRPQQFIDQLRTLVEREERGKLAALRRGLGKRPGEAPEMHPIVLTLMPREVSEWEEANWYRVASLFALHPHDWAPAEGARGHDLGASFAALRRKLDSPSVERRFVALLNSHQDDLDTHLRTAVSLLASHEIAIDYAQLLRDLNYWGHPERRVQRSWARSFWRGAAADEQPAGHEQAAPTA